MSHILDTVKLKMEIREEMGIREYGATVDRTDQSHLYWLIEAQSEAMDMVIYLEKLIQLENERRPTTPDAACRRGCSTCQKEGSEEKASPSEA